MGVGGVDLSVLGGSGRTLSGACFRFAQWRHRNDLAHGCVISCMRMLLHRTRSANRGQCNAAKRMS
ncbi:hypothetical protein BRO03_08710 [Xanthomonas oryzae pv. oryzae]|uniref:Uncharacterized protein n=1 Tax=Xanthomonas oryzae pv. oryzae (strain PXO99A) TaxID=360094 RepID=A0A0K0GFY9_XANOP|nr:hypothetical protein PXO_05444 [Xanthomonas oryzae pv. oryzae PXO99A]AXM38706.1 hypothetical protein BRN51_02190 [Xanthomonas oryzae pv. oryzae]QBA09791.1 hypothetical protein DZA53_02310 [Xanthomonas oryzae pv. oryzae]QBN89467.1 hypothetical protein EBA18_02130 [Xanthomonas oryzae pv. oryzae]QBO01105.1 hypothetical protein EBA21_02120 [Xanthomonas oryzae pv. oryzae]